MKKIIFLIFAAFIVTASVQAQTTVDSIAAKYKLVPMPEPLTVEKTFPVLGTYQLSTGANASMATSSTTSNTTTTSNASTTTTADASMATTASNSVIVTLDSVNKGVIWVEGLPQGKFKAYLKKSPATYRILAQKTQSGSSIPEGTLLFDPQTKTMSVALGKEYDETDPAAIFALNPALATSADATASTDATNTTDANSGNTVKVKVKSGSSKTKSKVTYFTANKIEQTTTSSDATAPSTQQPAQQ